MADVVIGSIRFELMRFNADGDSLTLVEASVDHGNVELTDDNKLKYTPISGFQGTALISYQVSDGLGGAAQGQAEK